MDRMTMLVRFFKKLQALSNRLFSTDPTIHPGDITQFSLDQYSALQIGLVQTHSSHGGAIHINTSKISTHSYCRSTLGIRFKFTGLIDIIDKVDIIRPGMSIGDKTADKQSLTIVVSFSFYNPQEKKKLKMPFLFFRPHCKHTVFSLSLFKLVRA